jgi:hypothetical protein
MTGLVVAMLAFRPPVVDDPSIVQAQAGGSGGKAAKAKAPSQPDRSLADTDGGARQRLQINKIDGEFNDVPVSDALTYLSDRIGVQFHIDKQSLENASVNNDTPVTLRLKNVPAEMLLDLILRQANLGYRLRNGVILVASKEDIQSQTEVRVYELPVGGFEEGVGLAEELAALIPATVEVNNWSEHTVVVGPRGRRRAGFGSAGAAGSSGGGYGSTGYGATGYGAVELREGESGESVGGGGVGTIRVFRGTLVVSQTPEVHQKIEKLLNDLSATGALNPERLKELRAAHRDLGAHGGPTGMPEDSRYGSGGAPGYGGAGYGQSSQPGYGQSTRGGRGQTGYGTTGRGGYGAGGSNGGYGATGRGAAADRSGYGSGPAPSRTAEDVPGQPPSSGGFTPVPRDPNAGSNAPPGPSRTGGQPPGTNDPNATQPGAAPAGGGSPPGLGASGGVAPNTPGGESGASAAAPAADPATGASAPSLAPAGAYGGAR